MRVQLFLLFFLFITTTSFFWNGEKKQVRELTQNAETAISNSEFESAKPELEELLTHLDPSLKTTSKKYREDWEPYVDAVLRLGNCYEELGQKEDCEKLLTEVLAKKPPENQICRIELMKARILPPQVAYTLMLEIKSKYAIENWPVKELSFFQALEETLNTRFETLTQKARRAMTAGFFEEAISAYEEILSALDQGHYPKMKNGQPFAVKVLRYRLAEAHFLAADYTNALTICEKEIANGDKIDREMLYLCALCYQKKHEYDTALNRFYTYLNLSDQTDQQRCDEHYAHALFEIGLKFYQKGQLEKARHYFDGAKLGDCRPAHLSLIYLARIALEENRPEIVEKLLEVPLSKIKEPDPLYYECLYLKGRSAFALKDYTLAQNVLEKSLAHINASWHVHALYYLGWSHLQLGSVPKQKNEERFKFLKAANECFEKLQGSYPDEALSLSLAQMYLLHFTYFKDERALRKMQLTLRSSQDQFSIDGQLSSLLLLAKGASNYKEKEDLLAKATTEQFKKTSGYASACYQRGLNHFEHGFFDLAIEDLEKALLRAEKGCEAAQILKLNAKSHFCRNNAEEALALIDKLLLHYSESDVLKEETLYLKAMAISKLPKSAGYSVEGALKTLLESYPNGRYQADALYALGAHYYSAKQFERAKNIFVRLSEQHPQFEHAPASLFWAAEAASFIGEDPSIYRIKTVTNYPESEWAAECYIRHFPYSIYLEGETRAIEHLKKFEELFPNAPHLISVNYLLGINEKEPAAAKRYFKKTLTAFSKYRQKKGTLARISQTISEQIASPLVEIPSQHSEVVSPEHCPRYAGKEDRPTGCASCRRECEKCGLEESYIYFRYKAMLALSQLEFEECEPFLTGILHEFSQEENPLTTRLKLQSGYPQLLEEAEFKLAHHFLTQGKDLNAQKIWMQMLARYGEAEISCGGILSQVWQGLGTLSLKCQDYETALKSFETALECGHGYLTEEQELSLWLAQSDAYRGKKEYDTAMRFLSRIINAETASPLKMKAMYLRAELYELEGRAELAVRQLEATSKKGGDWALKAQEKLKIKYGYE